MRSLSSISNNNKIQVLHENGDQTNKNEEYGGFNMFGLQNKAKVVKMDLVQTRINEKGETIRVVKIRKKKKD